MNWYVLMLKCYKVCTINCFITKTIETTEMCIGFISTKNLLPHQVIFPAETLPQSYDVVFYSKQVLFLVQMSKFVQDISTDCIKAKFLSIVLYLSFDLK